MEAMRLLLVWAVVTLFPASVLAADSFPSKPFELVITSSAGSGISNWGVMLGEVLSKPGYLGKPVHVLFKGGGSGNESATYTHEKPADGYTLLQMSGSHAGYFNLPTMRYKWDAFKFVARIQRTIYVVGVPGDSQFKSFKELMTYARAHPGELAMGSNKVGSIHHRMQVALWKAVGANVRFVPYKGTGKVVKDVIGHHLPIGMADPSVWAPHLKSGAARLLLVLSDKRIPELADVPVPSDLGIDVQLPVQFQALVVRKETPDDRVKVLQQAIHKAMESQEYKDYIKRTRGGQIPDFSDDTKALDADFRKAIQDAHTFMVENHIIQK
jgi:tripartite-type tricarboxylate transporter receptor subunit TctC